MAESVSRAGRADLRVVLAHLGRCLHEPRVGDQLGELVERHRIEVDVRADEPKSRKGDAISILPNRWWLFDGAKAQPAKA
jgi:hypothetical protein